MSLTTFTDAVGFAKAEVGNEWALACYHDGIHPDAPFVVFSPTNPHKKALDDASLRLQQAQLLAGARR